MLTSRIGEHPGQVGVLRARGPAGIAGSRRLLLAALLVAACDRAGDRPGREKGDGEPVEPPGEEKETGAPAQEEDESNVPPPPPIVPICDRPADDAVRDIFCKGDKRSVGGLRELLIRLDIPALPVDMDETKAAEIRVERRSDVVDHLVLLGHSTALSGNLVSPINPRAILMSEHTFVAYQRGVQKVEIATRDRVTERQNLYLINFTQDCNERAAGCRPGDLYTPDVERDWRAVTLRDDEDLKNTPLDCRQCHQRKYAEPVLLMRELFGPWPHFFFLDVPDLAGKEQLGMQLLRDFLSAKGDESYAGMPTGHLRQTAGGTLQKRIRGVNKAPQPLEFDPLIFLQTMWPQTGLRSALWDLYYANFKRGDHLAMPYFQQTATDPAKQRRLAEAYAAYRRGELSKDDLPDLGDIHPDDPQVRAEIGLQTEPNASPVDVLIQACASCHNDVLDPTISRSRFNVAVGRLPRTELDLAIERLMLPVDDEKAMPPRGMRQIDDEAKARLIEYLRQDEYSDEDNARLEHAARVGMAREVYSYAGI